MEVFMETDGFPKLQASLTVGDDMLVVRSNNKEEFLDLLKFIAKTRQTMKEKTVASSPTVTQANGDIPICGIHQTPMTWKTGVSKKTGKNYAFWSCNQRMQDGSFCTYKPAK